MKKIIFLIFVCSTITFSQWFPQTSGTNFTLFSNFFVNDQTGWIAGDGVVLKTSNGGTNWFQQLSGLNDLFISVFFVSPTTGMITCAGGFIYKTTNGGANWFSLPSPTSYNLNSVYFINTLTGWAVGGNGVIFKTTNFGGNWSAQQSNTIEYLHDVFFIDSNTGWISRGTWAAILKTTNSGINWITMHEGSIGGGSIWFANDQTGWVCGSSIRKTTDGGLNWFAQLSGQSLLSLFFTNINTGWCVGSIGGIYYTSNSGNNWLQQPSGITNEFRSVFFANQSIGWAVGGAGKIFKTTNGGLTFVTTLSSEIPVRFSLNQNYPNPFNPVTVIRFHAAERTTVKLIVYDALGRQIETLVAEELNAGSYETEFNGEGLASGVYFYKLLTEKMSITKKMLLIK